MNWVGKPRVLVLGAVLAAVVAHADVTEIKDNPYKVILDRNPFGLKGPPEAPTQPTNQAVKVDVKFTGITSDHTSKRAWFVIPPGPGRQQPKVLSLSEGDSDGDLKVLEINVQETTVKVLNAGNSAVLNFKDHGLNAPPAPIIQPPMPGALPAPGVPLPGVRTGASPYVPAPSVTPQGIPQASIAAPTVTPPPLRTIPARNLRTAPVEAQAVDPAVQYLNMKVNEEKARSRGIPHPPTPPPPYPGGTGVPSE